MIPKDKFPEIARGLLEKTRQRKAAWEENTSSRGGHVLKLKDSIIWINYFSPPTEPDYIMLVFMNKEGRDVGSWTVTEGEDHWDLVSELYGQIEKTITGWDRVLEDIEAFLKSG
jgi:hypothetical protein